MVLSRYIEVEINCPMTGIFDEALQWKSKQGLSYVIVQPTEKHFFKG